MAYSNILGGGYTSNMWAGYAGGSTTSPAAITNPDQSKGWSIVNNILGVGNTVLDLFNKAKYGKESVQSQGSIYNPNNTVGGYDETTYNGGLLDAVNITGSKPFVTIGHEIDYKPLMLIGACLAAFMYFNKRR